MDIDIYIAFIQARMCLFGKVKGKKIVLDVLHLKLGRVGVNPPFLARKATAACPESKALQDRTSCEELISLPSSSMRSRCGLGLITQMEKAPLEES